MQILSEENTMTANIQFTGHNIEITPALREYTANKFDRLYKLADNITKIQVKFNVSKLRQIVEANLFLPGTEIHAHSESENMYNSVTSLVNKLVRQLNKYKEKSI